MLNKEQIQELIQGKKHEMSLSDKLMRSVKEIKETNDFKEVNKLVKQSWILLGVVPNNGEYIFSLGRVEIKQD